MNSFLRTIFAVSVLVVVPLLQGCESRSVPPALPELANSAGTSTAGDVLAACPPVPGKARCLALIRRDVGGGNPRGYHGTFRHPGMSESEARAAQSGSPGGYGPTDLYSAYNIASAASTGGVGQTIALVDGYDDPNAESDLAVYRSQYGLPACTTANGCFRKVNEQGVQGQYPQADASWTVEISLDLDMVSAICPKCHILLVEATEPDDAHLSNSVNTAVSLGANAVSNSYYQPEYQGDTYYSPYYTHPGVAITVASGDSCYDNACGYNASGPSEPADFANVIAVGGTTLRRSTAPRGWSESAWSSTTSGCSIYVAKPAWQPATGCAMRMTNDIAAVADPSTGVAVYDSTPYYGSSGWWVLGGTSVSSPIVAAMYGLAGMESSTSAADSIYYAGVNAINDVTTGNNGSCSVALFCTAGLGYDGPTGMGTPNGVLAFEPFGSYEHVYVANEGPNSVTVYSANPSGNVTGPPVATIAGANTMLRNPSAVALDRNGRIYVANTSNNSITVYSANPVGNVNGAPLATIAGSNTTISQPTGLAVDANGRIYVANTYTSGNGATTVAVFAAGANGNASPVATIGGGATGIENPTGMAFDAAGRVYVANLGNQSVTVYAANPVGSVTSAPLATILSGYLLGPTGVAVDRSGQIYVSDHGGDAVEVYAANPSGTVNEAPIATITGSSSGTCYPQSVALDSSGQVYVGNTSQCSGNNSVTMHAIRAARSQMLHSRPSVEVAPGSACRQV